MDIPILTPEAIRRLTAVVARVEDSARSVKDGPSVPRRPPDPVQILKITGSVSGGLYPAKLSWWNDATATETLSDEVRWKPRDGSTPASGDYVWGRYSGPTAAGVHGLYVGTDTGGGTGGGFHARITTSAIVSDVVEYQIEEIEVDSSTRLFRAKVGGRTGAAYRAPSQVVIPPAIPVGQAVFAVESVTRPGEFEISAWGGQFGVSRERLVQVEGELIPNPDDCTTTVFATVSYYQTERLTGRELCNDYSPSPP